MKRQLLVLAPGVGMKWWVWWGRGVGRRLLSPLAHCVFWGTFQNWERFLGAGSSMQNTGPTRWDLSEVSLHDFWGLVGDTDPPRFMSPNTPTTRGGMQSQGHLGRCNCCSVAQSCLTLCNPMDCSTPGFPVLHCLLEFAQTHVHWVSETIQPSHPLLPPSPLAPYPQSFPAPGSLPMSRLSSSAIFINNSFGSFPTPHLD